MLNKKSIIIWILIVAVSVAVSFSFVRQDPRSSVQTVVVEPQIEFGSQQPTGEGEISTITPNYEFTIPELPGVSFRIKHVSKVSNGASVQFCPNAPAQSYLKYTDDNGVPSWECTNNRTRTVNLPGSALVIVDSEIINNGPELLTLVIFKLFYGSNSLSEDNSSWGVNSFSSRRMVLNFRVPSSQDEVRLVYGDYYDRVKHREYPGDELFGRTRGGLIIDFDQKTASEIPG